MKKVVLIYIYILFAVVIVSGQNFVPSNTTSFKFTPQNLGLSSPQSADFVRYGNLEMNLYNGLVDVDIPIYSYSDNDFELSLFAKYVSKIFKPSERPSIIGHNWMLHAGGVITREVVGAPDDTKGKNTSSIRHEYQPDGILAAIKNGNFKKYDENTFKNLLMERGKGGYGGDMGRRDFKHDFGPDIFKFSFGNFSGSFIIGNDGNPVLLEGKEYKVDITQLAVQEHATDNSVPKNSTIRITTPDGMIFEFGGNEYYFEYYVPKLHTTNKHKMLSKPRFISAWHLKSIIAPNGRKVEYSYSRTRHKNRYSYHVYNDDYHQTFSKITNPIEYYQDLFFETYYPHLPFAKFEMADEIHTPILNEIKVDNILTINFKTKSDGSFYPNESDDELTRLENISVKYTGNAGENNNNTIHFTEFDYTKQGQYFFLKTINNHNQSYASKKYNFDYILNKRLPNPLTVSTDHWGGWRGWNEISIDIKEYCENLDTYRSVMGYYADAGLLQKISYPTGGYTEFEYEPNRYINYLEKNINTLSVENKTLSNEELCAGARIKKVQDYDPTTNSYSNVRTFEYINPLTNKCSGSIGLKPQYETKEKMEYEVTEKFKCTQYIQISALRDSIVKIFDIECKSQVFFNFHTISSSILGTEKNIAEYPIGYSDVIEHLDDGSYLHYKFSSYTDTPDDTDSNYKMESKEYLDPFYFSDIITANLDKMERAHSDDWRSKFAFEKITDGLKLVWLRRITDEKERADKYGLFNLNDMSAFRGKLLSKTTYSADKKKVLEEINTYNFGEAKSSYQFSITSNDVGASWNKIYTTPCKLLEQKVTDINNVTSIVSYEYNNRGLLSKEKYYDSRNALYETRYLYPLEYPGTVYIQMKNLNIISPVIEKAMYKDNSFLHKQVKEYYSPSGSTNPRLFRISKERYKTGNGEEEVRVEYLKYDTYGNPDYVLVDGSVKTVLIWSYKGQHLIAKIENADYSTVNQKLGTQNINAYADTNNPDMTRIDNLREQLPDAMITTYTYDKLNPVKGIIAVTDPKGLKTLYEYDESGRLKESSVIEGNQKKVLQQYNYYYKSYKD